MCLQCTGPQHKQRAPPYKLTSFLPHVMKELVYDVVGFVSDFKNGGLPQKTKIAPFFVLPFPSLGRLWRLCLPTTWSDRGVRSFLIAKMKSPSNSTSIYTVHLCWHATSPPLFNATVHRFLGLGALATEPGHAAAL